MRTTSLLALFLALAPATALGQGKQSLRQYHGAVVRTVPTEESIVTGRAIGGLAVDDRGRIYSATFRRSVYRIERDGSVTLLNGDFQQASGNTIDNGGELLQSEYGLDQLYRVHEDGSRTLITDVGLSGPVGVVMDDGGDIFVVNYRGDTISRITPGGVTSQFSADPLLNGPNGILIDAAGDMYVVNLDDDLLLRIDAVGTATVVAALGNGQNIAHVAALGGKLYVSTIWTHEIYEVTTSGVVERIAGTGAPGTRNGFAHRATLYHPNGIATGPRDDILYTNNYIGTMGTPGSRMTVRTIQLFQ